MGGAEIKIRKRIGQLTGGFKTLLWDGADDGCRIIKAQVWVNRRQ